MAQLSDVIEQLLDEVAGRLEALDPVEKSSKRFRRQSERARIDQPDIGEAGHAPRLFEFGRSQMSASVRFAGSGTADYDVTIPILIQYPAHDGWHSAAVQDAHSIFGVLADNRSTTTGVHLREISLAPLIQFAPVAQDPRFVSQLTLTAHVEADV
jgi:hypothetical protein